MLNKIQKFQIYKLPNLLSQGTTKAFPGQPRDIISGGRHPGGVTKDLKISLFRILQKLLAKSYVEPQQEDDRQANWLKWSNKG